ncbi:MAG: bifunctional (p)ppGpp synthetase/guanosine-3',5'-bis(diphosphate) 3'-pyrophosphohydrolase [Zetaproteobacteria bacterium]|nr:MAG: bifunctional (p)ppGpp synthetase/guanosine-3',5'-bis(diphosphate) 3'-pyrophosphohydrolase [Zetaproteobacteria bacterium]
MSRIFEIAERVRSYSPNADIDAIHRAYVFAAHAHAGQRRISGEPYITHPLEVASILSRMRLDDATIITALLHDTVEDTDVTRQEIADHFGATIADLVDGVTKIGRIRFTSSEEKQVENFRKMILATAKDLRVLLVKLADRLHNMRTLQFMPPHKQRAISEETITLYAPLAHRMGIHWIKQSLEDLAFSYLEPEAYRRLDALVGRQRDSLLATKQRLERLLQEALADQGIETEVKGRLKHLYSLHMKMQHKHVDFNEIYDLVAFRIIVRDLQQCYQTLGVIHSLYRPIPGRIKDYIALPKPNGYQSLHTSIIGPEQHRIEVQIRTREMHRYAENGVAAHWIYKGGSEREHRHFQWLKELTELLQNSDNPDEFLENARLDLFVQEVYVFSRDGEIFSLPRGATALDFAYAIHTELGHHCCGIKINGERSDIRRQLRNGDQVEVLTDPDQIPQRSWLQIVRTPRAAQAIRQWFRRREQAEAIALGGKIMKAFTGDDTPDDALLAQLGCDNADTLKARLGRGEITLDRFIAAARVGGGTPLRLTGRNRITTHPADCCLPIPGDRVLGLLEGGHLMLHDGNCAALSEEQLQHAFEIQWDGQDDRLHTTGIEVHDREQRGMLASLTHAIFEEDANISDIRIEQRPGGVSLVRLLIDVRDRTHLANVIRALRAIKGVIRVNRYHPGGPRRPEERRADRAKGIGRRVQHWLAHLPRLGRS